MDFTLLPNDLEELIVCSCCNLPFNDTDSLPKLFSCRHYFCLKCMNHVLMKGNELYCIHCWKRTELTGPDMKPENLPTYNAILYLAQNMMSLSGGGGGSGGGGSNNSTGGNSGNGNSGSNKKPPDKQLLLQNNNNSSTINLNTNNNNNSSVTNANLTKYRNKGENCLTHAMPNGLWCLKCNTLLCRACASTDEHRNHNVKSQNEARDQIRSDIASDLLLMQKSLTELQHFVFKQRDFLLKILEACTALKTQVETELINHLPTFEVAEIRSNLTKAKLFLGMLEQQSPVEAYKLYANLNIEKQRLQSKYQEMFLQCKLDDLIQHYGVLFDFDLIKQALSNLNTLDPITLNGGCTIAGSPSNLIGGGAAVGSNTSIAGHHNSILLLANYCISQLYSRHILTTKHHQIETSSNYSSSSTGRLSDSHHSPKSLYQPAIGHHSTSIHPSQAPGAIGSGSFISQLNDTGIILAPPLPPSHQQQQQLAQQQLSSGANSIIVGSLGSNSSGGNGRSSVTTPYLSEIIGSNNSSSVVGSGSANSVSVPITIMQHLQHSNQHSSLTPPNLNHMTLTAPPLPPSTSSSSNSSSITISQQQQPHSPPHSSAMSQQQSMMCNPSVHVYPIYFFNIEINGQPFGRILIEVRNDVAPKMAKNFGALCTGELGFGYKGCTIFQCWENESIITGDFELNNGRGGRSVFEEGFFMPDDTKILAIRGSVGMRRSQKRHDNMGLVGSQFRIILREMRGFTGIFAFVVDGLELVEKISQAGDSAGKPQSNVLIVNCGKWQ
uniref:Putative intracellular n=1 Tax=Corethrella appendiculata TaxID=1370023 RepID=U5EYP3_9DIPT